MPKHIYFLVLKSFPYIPQPSAPDLDAPDGSEEDDEGEWERRAAAGEPGPASNFLLHWIDNLSLPTALAATLPPEAITQQLSRRERAAGLGEAPSVRGRALDDPTKPVMLKVGPLFLRCILWRFFKQSKFFLLYFHVLLFACLYWLVK